MPPKLTIRPALAIGLSLLAARAMAQGVDEPVRWLEEHAVPFRSIDPADENFSDLQPLKEAIGRSRIVMLGEQSHGDGATFLAKIRLIKFLHQEAGFDVLAFESGLYDCRKAWDAFQAGGDAQAAAQQGVFGVWSQSAQVAPLWSYLRDAAATDRPLELWGFDSQLTGASAMVLTKDLQQLVHGAGDPLVDGQTWATLKEFAEQMVLGRPPESEARRNGYHVAVNTVLEALSTAGDRDPAEIAFWRQVLKSLDAQATVSWRTDAKQAGTTLAQRFNPRDAQMADNLLWLARQRYPERRIIVWGATMHLQRNPQVIDTLDPALDYTGVEPMGHLVAEALGEQVFTIGFTTYKGRAGLPWGKSWDIPAAVDGSLEALCVKAGLENAFISFRGLPADSWARRPQAARPLGHQPMIADWSQVLDGMVFTRLMFPSARVGQPLQPEQNPAPELLAMLDSEWSRASLRLAAEQPYADKVAFFLPYRRWKQSATRSPADIQAASGAVETWLARKPPSADLAWRANALLSRMAADRGETALALERIDQALELYPDKRYADPANRSFFQHLVNEKAMRIWDQQGPDAAIDYAAGMLATDRRFDYFFTGPWRKRLSGPENLDLADRMRRSVIAAYKRRGERFPDLAKAAAGFASELRGGS